MKGNECLEGLSHILLSIEALKCGHPWKGNDGSIPIGETLTIIVVAHCELRVHIQAVKRKEWKFFTFPMHI